MFQHNRILSVRCTLLAAAIAATTALGGCAAIGKRDDPELSRALSGGYKGGETVAVLLPESGRFAGAAGALRDGILAAHGADEQAKRPQVRFYDVRDAQSVPATVQRAAAEGASLVIGPLDKEAVDRLAAGAALPVPTLALNRVSTGQAPPQNLFQFALAPEDEAEDVANKAWEKGYRNALVLYPDGNWGSRVARGFQEQWAALGGKTAASQMYDPNGRGIPKSVASLLGASAERGDTAGAGADFLFLVATSQTAREITPQIRNLAGGELPIYATSHVYGGRFDPKGDVNLVGLYFVDIPWLVAPPTGDALSREAMLNAHPKIQESYMRLYAMGIDAYRLAPRLGWLSQRPDAFMQGKTGTLRLDSERRIHRQLDLARMGEEGPVPAPAGAQPVAQLDPWTGIAPVLAAAGSAALANRP